MKTLAELADYIAANGIEITAGRVRWRPVCDFCHAPLTRNGTYEIVTETDLVILCDTCAARLATIAIRQLPHVQ